jgi:CarD family transcriptional regulator
MGVHNLFQIGDKVFYPLHGAGIIDAIEEKEVLGKTQEYYVIHIPISKMDVMIPIDRIQKSGIRSITDKDMMKEILDEFHHDETGDLLPWKERYLLNMEKMKTGEMNDSADVVHNLLLRSKEKTLNTTERQMLNQARRNLISEIVLITDLTEDQATDLLKIS